MPTLRDLVVINKFWISALCPAPRGFILLAGKDRHRHRNGDAFCVEEPALVFPIQARRRDTGVCQPVKRDVVEYLVTRQLTSCAGRSVESRSDGGGRLAIGVIVIEKPGSEADGRIRDA